MGTFKKLSRELIKINKNKQRLLNSAGYNIKVDGSWGPWQELLYNKIMSRGKMFTDKRAELQATQAKWENDHHKAIAGYYFSDTPTLPNLAKGTYHWLMGNVFGDSENPYYYTLNVGDAPNAGGPAGATKLPTTAKEFVLAVKNFRVPTLRTLFGLPTKDINVGRLSFTTRSLAPVITTVTEGSNLVPIRGATVNLPPNTIVAGAPKIILSTSKIPAVYGSTTRTIAERVGQRPTEVVNTTTGSKIPFLKGYNKGLEEGLALRQGLDDALRASQSQIIERDQQILQLTEELKLLKEGKVALETAQAAKPTIRVVEPTVSLTAPAQTAAPAQATLAAQAPAPAATTSAANSGKGFWGNLLRALWETKDNNFNKYYIGRNILRGVGYPITIPPVLGAGYEYVPKAFISYGDYAKKSFNFGRGKTTAQDSTRVDSTSRDSSLTALSTDSLQVQLSQSVFPQVKGDTIKKEDLLAIIDSLSRR